MNNSPNSTSKSRHFYLIAHRVNTLSKIKKCFKQGVNGIECDLWCDDDKNWSVSHDGIQKTELKEWLTAIGAAEKKYNRELALIIFDIKHDEPISPLRDTINSLLPAQFPRVYSVAQLKMAHIFTAIVPSLQKHEAIAIDEEDDPKEVAAFFQQINASQCWYGNGITLIPLDGQYHDSMQQAATIRDSTAGFKKIYTWSIHHKEHMQKYILEDKVDGMLVGLNGVLTRPVSKALKIIKANEGIKLADRSTPVC